MVVAQARLKRACCFWSMGEAFCIKLNALKKKWGAHEAA
jgi:hypothetical protein